MESIFDIVTAQSLASYWNNVPNADQNYLGAELFPAKKQLGTEIKWIVGSRGVPVELKASTLDAKVMIRDRRGFGEIKTKLPFFKEAMYIDEDLRQRLNMVIATGNQVYIDAVLNEVFNDEMQLLRGARVTVERMRMQLLSTGAIAVNNNGTGYEYDYGLEEHQKVTLDGTEGKIKWDDAVNSRPIEDLVAWCDLMEQKTGVRPTRAIMTSKTFNLIVKNEAIAKSIYITNNGIGVVTPSMVLDVLKVYTGLTIAVYDKVYGQVGTDGTEATKFFPDNVVTLIPEGNLGSTVFGSTPEESDLMSNPNIANVKIVDVGVAVTTTKEADPVNVKTKVSEMVMPSFEQADKILIAQVA